MTIEQARLLYAILDDAMSDIWWHVYPKEEIREIMDLLTDQYGTMTNLDWMEGR